MPNRDVPPSDDADTRGLAERIYRFVPALDALRGYTLPVFRADLMAGLTVATVAVPQAMAYAMVVGIPPEYGLYTAIVMTAVGALFDSSRQLINGPTNAIAIALLSALAAIPDPDQKVTAAFFMAFLVGVIQTGITLFRLGDLTRYVSNAVIVGFTLGASVLLVLDQFKNLVGLPAWQDPHAHFLVRFWMPIWQGGGLHVWTTVLGVGTIVCALALRKLNERLRFRLPEFLTTMVLAGFLVWLFGLERHGVAVVGTIPQRLPSFAFPELNWQQARELSGSALAIALLGLLEAIAMAKYIAAQTGQKIDINQQCLSEGLANLSGSFFQCFPGSGSLTRSAINQQTGAQTQWSGVISALAVAVTILLLAPLAYFIPRAALAGILMVTAYRMIDRKKLIYHLRATRFDTRIVMATALAAVFISVEFCILVGVFLSFLLYVPRAARVHMSELTVTPERVIRERIADDPPCNRLLIYNLEGELFFGAAPHLEEQLERIERRADAQTKVVVLRLKRARNPDAVCLSSIEEFVRRLQARKITVFLCGVNRDLARAMRNIGLDEEVGRQHVFAEKTGIWSSTLDAVRRAYELVGADVCENCPRREEQQAGDWYYMI
ncbi:MAG: SulP family inorganic anion transporter [Gemmataceae bacterium]